MSSRGEKGFRQIQIVDSNFDYSEQYETQSISRTKLILIVSIVILIVLLLIVIILIFDGKKKKKFSMRRNSNYNKTNNYINYNQSNNDHREYYNEYKKEEKTNEIYNIDEIIKNVEKTVNKQESNIKDNIKISIIIMNNYKETKNELDKLYESIISQEFLDKEIIIVGNNLEINSTSNIEKIKKETTIVEYEIKTGKIMQRYDIVNMAKGEYILFIETDDTFSSNKILKQIYEKATNDKLDILEYKSYHQMPPKDRILYQPEIFSSMHFGEDNFNRLTQFHLCGKLIKRDFFLDTFKEVNISPFYFKKNIQNFDQSMILLILLRKAKTFEVLDIQGTTKPCTKCEKNKNVGELKEALNLLVYMKFLIEYTGDNVPEKRMAVNIFINDFLNKRINFEDKDDLNLVKETLELYLKCNKIGEQDIKTIENYRNDILDKLKNI